MKFFPMFLLFILVFFASSLFPQQIKTIDNSGVGDFQTFNQAISYLDALAEIPDGGIIFHVTAGQAFVENPPMIQFESTLDKPIIFQKFGTGANPVIAADSLGSDDAVIFCNHSAFITFDGIDITDNDATDDKRFDTAVYIFASKNISFKNCKISDFNKYGIFVRDASQNIVIENNEVFYSKDYATIETTIYGIYVAFNSEADNVTIVKNKVYGLKYPASTLYGIRVFKVSSIIANNFISLPDDGNDKIFGLRVDGGDNINFQVYFNTVYLGGSSIDHGYALNTTGGSSSSFFNIKNNIFINNRTGNDQLAVWVSFDAGNFDLDYNLYFCGDEPNNFLGKWFQVDALSFSEWQAAAKGDGHSVNKNVEFFDVANNDLHLAGSSLGDYALAGIPIIGFEDDIDGDKRSPFSPYKGADENVQHPFITGIAVFPAELDFGYQKIGAQSPTQSFTIYNPGNALLIVDSVRAPLGFRARPHGQGDWVQKISSFLIIPGDSAVIDVQFAPHQVQLYRDNISIASNDSKKPLSYVAVKGQSFKLFFEEVPTNLKGAYLGQSLWGDFDNDDDLDILLTGYAGETGKGAAFIYRNDGTKGFVDANVSLLGVGASISSWVDYDNDGDLDLFLSGQYESNHFIAKIYQNNNGAFKEINTTILPLVTGSADWGDYDLDGDLDLLLTGKIQPDEPYTLIYRNDGNGKFTVLDVGLPRVSNSDAKWGDYDNDGDLDIALTGRAGSGNYISMILRNDGGNMFVDIGANLPGLRYSNINWGDYDGDGDLDLLLGGSFANEIPSVAQIFRNDGNDVFTNIHAEILGVRQGDLKWGDLDNDGDLDIIMNGIHTNEKWIGYIYLNLGNDKFILADSLVSLKYAQISLGDFDNDNDLDILLSGRYDYQDYRCMIFENKISDRNTPPETPKNFRATTQGNRVVFTWDAATDAETPATGLTYNLRVGSAPGKSDIVNSSSNPATGFRLIPAMGNMGTKQRYVIPKLSSNTYYCSIQAIDNCYIASPFSEEIVIQLSTVADAEGVALPDHPFLGKNYPNPFNSITRIEFGLSKNDHVEIKIYNINGQLIRTLVDERREAGYHAIDWDGCDQHLRAIPSGTYFVKMTAGKFTETSKVILIR